MSSRNHFATRHLNYQLSMICPQPALRQLRHAVRRVCEQQAIKLSRWEESLLTPEPEQPAGWPPCLLQVEFHSRAETAMQFLQELALQLGGAPLTRLRLDVLSVADWPAARPPRPARAAERAVAVCI
ncbi:hypothetical protein CEK28_10750 [Xenophilus sp. AP218F]|nr:hypothetical protein [Chromobacterium sp. ASV5]OWY38576.1 hypothetical protein CEK28_10750 [Xenophilus sp. AP218F]